MMIQNISSVKSDIQGASRLILEVDEAVTCFINNPSAILSIRYPTIATQKGGFPPVLFASRLVSLSSHSLSIEEIPEKLRYTFRIVSILKELQAGNIDINTGAIKYLSRQMGSQISWRNTTPLFDLFYGALQLLAYSELVDTQNSEDAHDLFTITCGMGLVIAEILNAHSLPYHIDHFKAHASVFLAARESSQVWDNLLERAIVYLEKWGDEPPPESVLIHAAHNLFIKVQGQPETDHIYDIVKTIREEVRKDRAIDIKDAFSRLNTTIGWKQSSSLLRLLWNSETKRHYEFTRDAVNCCLMDQGYQAAADLAQRIQFVGDDGFPLVKTPPSFAVEQGATLLFPGGACIGKTSTICKIGGSYVMVDYGRDPYGRAPHWRPEIDMLDAVLITHAHQDHIGGLVDLYGRQGYEGPWYAPANSEALIRLSLLDSVKLEASRFGENARYKDEDVFKVFSHFIPLKMGKPVSITDKITAIPFDAGHVTGSCQYLLESDGASVFFSGDFNLSSCLSVPPLELPSADVLESVDALVIEGTNAFRDDAIIDGELAAVELLRMIRSQDIRPVLIPVLSLGRAQEVISVLSGSEFKVGVFGLARRMTYAMNFPLRANIILDDRRPEDVNKDDYDVLVASSGCLQGGPSKIFFEREDLHQIPTILTGFLFPGTPAKNLVDQLPRVRFSAHARHKDWTEYLEKFPNATRFLIHYPGDRNIKVPERFIIPRIGKAYRIKK